MRRFFFLRFCAIHIRKFERLTIISYLFSYNTFENTSEYKHQNKDRQLHYIPTTQHEKNVWNLKSSNILTYLRMWFRIFKRKNQHSGTSKKCWITFILEVKEANGSLKDHKPLLFSRGGTYSRDTTLENFSMPGYWKVLSYLSIFLFKFLTYKSLVNFYTRLDLLQWSFLTHMKLKQK